MVGTIRGAAIAALAALFVQNCPIAENGSVEAGWRHGGRNRCCNHGHRHTHRGYGYAAPAYTAPAAAPCCQAQAYSAPMPDGSVPYEHSVGYPPNVGTVQPAVQPYDGQAAPVPTPTQTYTPAESTPAPAAGAIDQTPPPASPPQEAAPAAAPEPAPNPEN